MSSKKQKFDSTHSDFLIMQSGMWFGMNCPTAVVPELQARCHILINLPLRALMVGELSPQGIDAICDFAEDNKLPVLELLPTDDGCVFANNNVLYVVKMPSMSMDNLRFKQKLIYGEPTDEYTIQRRKYDTFLQGELNAMAEEIETMEQRLVTMKRVQEDALRQVQEALRWTANAEIMTFAAQQPETALAELVYSHED